MRARFGSAILLFVTSVLGCGGATRTEATGGNAANASGSEGTVPTRAGSDANGETTGANSDANPLPQRTGNDRTVLTRERCVLASNCDAELAQLQNATSAEDIHRRADLRVQLCDAGIVRHCTQAAIDSIHDRTVAINTAVARRRAATACRATHAQFDCDTYAHLGSIAAEERRARGLPPDPSDAAGDAAAASAASASSMPTASMGNERPFAEASLSSECRAAWTACQNNDNEGCAHAALCFVTGNGAPLDQVRAANLYRRACDRGVAYSCTELGIMLLQGEGIPQDASAARTIYLQGCRGGDLRGCSEAGLMLVNAEGGPADVSNGLQLLDRACTGGHTHACALLGAFMYEHAQNDDDRSRGALLVREACRRGDAAACPAWHRIEGH